MVFSATAFVSSSAKTGIPLSLQGVICTLHMPVQKGWFLGIPIPKVLLPKSETREYEMGGTFHFDVSLSAPLCGLLVKYQGLLMRDT